MPLEKLGRYHISHKLARGGMAEIFLAKLVGPAGFEKQVVIKKILPEWSADPDFVSMLIDEAKILVQLNHPNIIQVYELACEKDSYYIAMEYLQGVDLRRFLQKLSSQNRKMPLEVVVLIGCQVLEALSYAHAKKDAAGRSLHIIHRDISPQNILVSFDGAVKVTDFGIARAQSRHQETHSGVLKGKFAYMSPEQANQQSLDHRSDLFAVAVVLYELATGEKLFQTKSDIETLDSVRRGMIKLSSQAAEHLPEEFRHILFKALEKKREDRYPDAATFREGLLELARKMKINLRKEALSSLLSELFVKESEEEKERSDALLSDTRVMTASTSEKAHFIRKRLVYAGGVILLALVSFLAVRFFSPSPAESLSSSQTKLPDAKKLSATAQNTSSVGYLSVQAKPWGHVFIDGLPERLETPLRKHPLSPGSHKVEVVNDREGRTLSSLIRVTSEREVVCMAQFQKIQKIECLD